MLFEVAQTVNANGIAVNNLEINVCLHFVANSRLALFFCFTSPGFLPPLFLAGRQLTVLDDVSFFYV